MGSKGSNQVKSQSTQTYTPDPRVQQTGYQALGMASNAANLPFQMPVAPVAGFSPFQALGFGETLGAQGMAQPYFGAGSAYLGGSAAPVSAQDVGQYYNPMAGNVTAQMQNIFGQQMRQATDQATQQAGGVGADRIGVAQANIANQQGLAAGQTYSQLYQQALQAAQQQKQMMAGAGYGLAQMGPAAQASQLQGISALMGAGGLQQQLAQQQMNAPYQNILAQIAFPYQQAQYLAGITGGLAPAMGGTTQGQQTTTYPSPSPLSQMLGIGTSLLGLGGMGGMFGGGGGKGGGMMGGLGSMFGGGGYGNYNTSLGWYPSNSWYNMADGGSVGSDYGKLSNVASRKSLGSIVPAGEAGNPMAMEMADTVGEALPHFQAGGTLPMGTSAANPLPNPVAANAQTSGLATPAPGTNLSPMNAALTSANAPMGTAIPSRPDVPLPPTAMPGPMMDGTPQIPAAGVPANVAPTGTSANAQAPTQPFNPIGMPFGGPQVQNPQPFYGGPQPFYGGYQPFMGGLQSYLGSLKGGSPAFGRDVSGLSKIPGYSFNRGGRAMADGGDPSQDQGPAIPAITLPKAGGASPIPNISLPMGGGHSGLYPGQGMSMQDLQMPRSGGGGGDLGKVASMAMKLLPMVLARGGGVGFGDFGQPFQDGGGDDTDFPSTDRDIFGAIPTAREKTGRVIDLSFPTDSTAERTPFLGSPPQQQQTQPLFDRIFGGTRPAGASLPPSDTGGVGADELQRAQPLSVGQISQPMGAGAIPTPRPAEASLDDPSASMPDVYRGGYETLNKSYGPKVASAILGNLGVESPGLNPRESHDQGTGVGIAGWRNERRDALYDFAGANGLNPNTRQTQLAFLQHEINSNPRYADMIRRMQAARSPSEAARIFRMEYERPAGTTQGAPLGVGRAMELATNFAGGDFSGVSGSGAGPMGAGVAGGDGRRYNRDMSISSYRMPTGQQPYPDALQRDWGQQAARSPWMSLVKAGAAMAQATGPIGSVIGKGIEAGAGALEGQRKDLRNEQDINMKAQQLYQQAAIHLDSYQRETPYQSELASYGKSQPVDIQMGDGSIVSGFADTRRKILTDALGNRITDPKARLVSRSTSMGKTHSDPEIVKELVTAQPELARDPAALEAAVRERKAMYARLTGQQTAGAEIPPVPKDKSQLVDGKPYRNQNTGQVGIWNSAKNTFE